MASTTQYAVTSYGPIFGTVTYALSQAYLFKFHYVSFNLQLNAGFPLWYLAGFCVRVCVCVCVGGVL